MKHIVHYDERIITWRRSTLEFEAENEKEIVEKLKKIDVYDISNMNEFVTSEILYECEVNDTDNSGEPIVEIFINDKKV
jgi:hypothetical protein